MKKNRLKLTFIFTFLIICLSCFFTYKVAADDVVVYNANEWETFKNRTKADIGLQYSNAKAVGESYDNSNADSWYSEEYSLSNPYAPGRITQDTHDSMVAMTNFYRWLVGVDNLTGNSVNNDQLQLEALIRNFSWGHYVDNSKKPDDMPDEMWTEGSRITHNILAWGFTPRGAITGWLDEGYDLDYQTFDTLGHRMALIGPTVSRVNFGFSGKIAIGAYAGGNTQTLPYSAFPAPGYMPTESLSVRSSAWNIQLNKSIITYANEADVIVRVTNLNTNESYDCTKENGKLLVSGNLAFVQPDVGTKYYNEGDKFKVEVLGLIERQTNKPSKIEYTVDFFDIADYTSAKAVQVNPDYKKLVVDGKYMNTTTLNLISRILPKKVNVITDTGRSVEVDVNNWVLDEDNSKWTTTIVQSSIPDYVLDSNDHILSKNIEITYRQANSYATLSVNRNPIEGSSGKFMMYRYLLNANMAYIYQINNDDEVSLRYTEKSDNYSFSNGNFQFEINSYNLNDSGTYLGIYKWDRDTEAYFGGINTVDVQGKTVKSIAINSNPKNTYKVGDSLSVVGGKLDVTYSDNSTNVVDIAENMISGFDTTSAGVKDITVTLDGKTTTYSILVINNNINLSAIYGDKLKDIILPTDSNGAYSWANGEVSVGNAGSNTFNIVYNPTDGKYSAINNVVANVNVLKAVPSYAIPTGLEATYGDTLSDVTLPSGFVFEQASNTKVGNAGINSFKVTYTPSDTNNYLVVEDIDVNVKVNKANPTYTVPTNIEAGFGDTLDKVVLPEGFSFMDNSLSVGNVGTNIFKAKYTPSDTNNYNVLENIDINVKVGKATPDFVKPNEVDATYCDTLNNIVLPTDSNGTFSFVKELSTKVGNVGKHTFEVVYTPNDTENYRSVTFNLDVNVKKANPTYTIPTDLEAIYGDKLSDVLLPQGFSYVDNSLSVGNVGVNSFDVIYTPVDTNNYNVCNDKVNIKVNKATPIVPSVTLEPVVYGSTLKDITLPEGFSWKNPNTSVGNVGEKSFTAIYTPTDINNYLVKEVELNVIVVKYIPSNLIINDIEATYGDKLSSITLPSVSNGTYKFVKDLNTKVGNVGERIFYVDFIPTDKDNFDVVNDIPVKIIVKKAKGEVVVKPVLSAITYNPNGKLSDITLPSKWSFDNPNEVPVVNNSGYKVTYTPADTLNYDYSDQDLNPTISLVVYKANPSYDSPILSGYVGDKLKDISLPIVSNGTFSYKDEEFVLTEAKDTNVKVVFTPNDTNNYNVINDIDATVKVNKTKPSYTVPTNLEATYGDKLSDVVLPHGFSFNDSNSSVGNVGVNKFLATYTPDDLDNYSVVNNIEISIKVNKKKASKVKLPVINEMNYNPNRKLSDINLGDNWSFDNPNEVPVVNNNGYKATYTPDDTLNYDYSDQDLNPTLEVKVKKINPVFENPNNIEIEWKKNIGNEILPMGFKFNGDYDFVIGENDVNLTYTPEDTNNYNIVKNIPCKVIVKKARPNVTNPDEIIIPEEEAGKLKDIELPKGWVWVDDETEVNGVLAYRAKYIPEDIEHYEVLFADVVVRVSSYVPETPDNNIEIPNTIDNVLVYVLVNILSFGLIIGLFNRKKKLI